MATKAEAVKARALSRVGCPYVMGGTGKECSVQYREARAAQYPDSAALIRANCPQLSGSATSCSGCKYQGKPCFDCAQLALDAMKAAGIPLVSGANSQWRKTRWAESGQIGALPRNKVCLVFREDADGKKHHVGVYLGDGTVVHAKGHNAGVVQQDIGSVKFTHYGVPLGLYDSGLPTVRRGNSGEYVEKLQQALILSGHLAEGQADGKFGSITETAVRAFQAAQGLSVDGICGKDTWAALAPWMGEDAPQDDDEDVELPDPDPDEQPGRVMKLVDQEELYEVLKIVRELSGRLEAWVE